MVKNPETIIMCHLIRVSICKVHFIHLIWVCICEVHFIHCKNAVLVFLVQENRF